jgi:ABC-2 type transport system ATP-binding protein
VTSAWRAAGQRDEISFGDADDQPLPAAGGQLPGAAGPAITTSGLTKRFRGGQVTVDGVDLAVPHGSVYGFLGPNGSGKTTTIRMLLGLVHPTRGSHELLGVDMPAGTNAVLSRVGSLVEGPAFYSQLSGRANLARCDAADRTADPRTADARIAAALDRVGLLSAARKHYRAYSLGMKQRLAIAASLLRPRELLILDEPTNGLDPQGTREVRGLIRDIGPRARRSSSRPPAGRSRADLLARRRDADRGTRVPGHPGRAAEQGHRADPGSHSRACPGRRGAGETRPDRCPDHRA